MYKTILILFVTFGIFGKTNAQVLIDEIVFDKTKIEFGNILVEDGIQIAKFSFTNTSKNDFQITAIDVACGCTNPRSSSNIIKPGERGTITAEFNPAGMLGEIDKWVYVKGNFSNGFQKDLHFTASIRSSVQRDPNSYFPGEFGYLLFHKTFLDLGWSTTFVTKRDSLLVSNDGYENIIISAVNNMPPFIAAELPLSLAPKEFKWLYFNINPSVIDTIGNYSGTMHLETNDAFYPKKEITYQLIYADDFSKLKKKDLKNAPKIALETQYVDLGKMKSGELKSKPFTIRNEGKTNLLIKRVDTDCTCAILNNLKRSIAPGETITVVAQLDALYKQGKQTKSIVLYTNDPKNSKIIVSIAASVE